MMIPTPKKASGPPDVSLLGRESDPMGPAADTVWPTQPDWTVHGSNSARMLRDCRGESRNDDNGNGDKGNRMIELSFGKRWLKDVKVVEWMPEIVGWLLILECGG